MSKVKDHFGKYKVAYISSGAFALGVGVTAVVLRTPRISVVGNRNQVVGSAKVVNQIMLEMVERSTPSKPVHLVGTNLYFESLNEAARQTGHALSMISKNVNGHIPDIKGDVFKLLDKSV